MNQHSTNLDRVIDDAARGITAHDPPAHLRTRVLARLDERRAPRRAWLLLPAAAAALAAVVTMFAVNRAGQLPEATPFTTPPASVALETPGRVEIPGGAANQQAPLASVAATGRRASTSSDASAWREELMPSLPAIDALGIAAIQPDTLTIPQLTVKPLVVAPIDANNDGR